MLYTFAQDQNSAAQCMKSSSPFSENNLHGQARALGKRSILTGIEKSRANALFQSRKSYQKAAGRQSSSSDTTRCGRTSDTKRTLKRLGGKGARGNEQRKRVRLLEGGEALGRPTVGGMTELHLLWLLFQLRISKKGPAGQWRLMLKSRMTMVRPTMG